MGREKDVCWEYCEKLEGNKVRCKFCLKVLNGGISRLKLHLLRLPGKGVQSCSKVRDEVTNRVRGIIAMKEKGKEAVSTRMLVPVLESTNSTPPPVKHFPSSTLATPQPPLDADRCIAEFLFQNKLDFSVANSSSYQRMLEVIGGAGFRGPSAETLKTTWLQKLKSEVKMQINDIEQDWETTGFTIIADTWTDNKSRAFINFFVSSRLGTFFHKSVDASTYFKNTKFICVLFDSVIQELGPEKIVQVIFDNTLNLASVGNYIMQNYSSIFWSPCASHCVNLILEDFCKINWVNRCIIQAQSITRFIYNHTWLHELMINYMGGQEIVRCGITQSVSNFLSLQSMLKHRSRLKCMFNSPEYSSSAYANQPHSLSCMDILNGNQFWRAAEEIAAVSEPLLKVLRDVSGGKPAVGSIYESMMEVKDSLRTYYVMDELKCKTFLDIIDRRWLNKLHSRLYAAAAYLNPSIQYNPEVKFIGIIKEDLLAVLEKMLPTPESRHNITSELCTFRKAQQMFGSNLAKEARTTTFPGIWWEQYGDSAPGLQHVAVRILSQVCSGLIYEKNWSTIQQIHSEKRNSLDKETLIDLLFVHYNLKLLAKGKPAEVDPITLDEIDMTTNWVEETENFPSPAQWLDLLSSC